MKKRFNSIDYSFCSYEECDKKENCMRCIEHYPELRDKVLSYVLIEDSENCNMYVQIKG